MIRKRQPSLPAAGILVLVTASGLAALSWEVLWQLKAGLALGVSAWGTALTLAITMGGMGAGALLAGRFLRERKQARPTQIYGLLELVIGGCGLLLQPAFHLVEQFDTYFYIGGPGGASCAYILGIASTLGLPALCMGATLPVLGMLARQFGVTLPLLYGLNTLGAAAGVLLTAFFLIPAAGVLHASWLIAGLNLAAGVAAVLITPGARYHATSTATAKPRLSLQRRPAQLVVAATGFATLALEVAWFRSLTAAFSSTTVSFAIMLAAVLAALGIAANLVGPLKAKKINLGLLVTLAGILILLATPLVERFDMIDSLFFGDPLTIALNRFAMTLYIIGPPVALLGIALPWLLDELEGAENWGRLYALNTLAAIAGSLAAAWLLLPTIGFARTAWLAGALVAAAGIRALPRDKRRNLGIIVVAALAAAVILESGAGRTRAQGHLIDNPNNPPVKILENAEGPEATVSAVEFRNGGLALVIDGFVAASQFNPHGKSTDHYMAWMGTLPMLLHPHPENALVICFGTGQTANAVRNENPRTVDVADVNPRVFGLAHNFDTNQDVLADKRVMPLVVDGRAWLRRSKNAYDVITLEPMPPNFAGVNALYSAEFYDLAKQRLRDGGIIAQWVPFHLVGTHYITSIVRTFREAFPDAVLWLDPVSKTGILLGSKDGQGTLGTTWPGMRRRTITREYTDQAVKDAVFLDSRGLGYFSETGETITDDNQLLAYGRAVAIVKPEEIKETYKLLKDARARADSEIPEKTRRPLPPPESWP